MQGPDICAVMEGHTRPTEETHQAEETTQLLTLGVLYTPDGSRIRPRQWRPPVRNLVLVTDKAAALLEEIHAYDEHRTRGHGQNAKKVLKMEPDKTRRLEMELVGKSGAQGTNQHAATLSTTCKELRARRRRPARTRLLS